MPMSCATGHKTSKLKVNASYTRPKCVGMLSSAICAFESAIYELPTRQDGRALGPSRSAAGLRLRGLGGVCSGVCHRSGA